LCAKPTTDQLPFPMFCLRCGNCGDPFLYIPPEIFTSPGGLIDLRAAVRPGRCVIPGNTVTGLGIDPGGSETTSWTSHCLIFTGGLIVDWVVVPGRVRYRCRADGPKTRPDGFPRRDKAPVTVHNGQLNPRGGINARAISCSSVTEFSAHL
jgi:hypothetical protein